MDIKPSLYGLDQEELKDFLTGLGEAPFRATQLADWLYKKNISSLSEAKNLPPTLAKRLEEKSNLNTLMLESDKIATALESQKFLFKTRDGRFLESVLISQSGRRTLCVSSQLGCKVGCPFCASGKGAFGRNLEAAEIIEQVAKIQCALGERISNIVFMGMGEPLDNFENVMKALRILQEPWGFGISSRKITVSTSGITPKIKEFVKRNEGRVRLSISLHSSINEKRNELVPINKKYSLDELKKTLKEVHEVLKRDIVFEYTLMAGENDSKEEALGVAKIAGPLHAKVNIIPYNPIREMQYKRPSASQIHDFQEVLKSQGVRVIVRQTAGREIDAACGQLRLDRERV